MQENPLASTLIGAISLTDYFNLEKDCVRAAIDGNAIVGKNDSGYIYRNVSKDECKTIILHCFDNAVYHALHSFISEKASELTLEEYDFDIFNDPQYYIKYLNHCEKLRKEQNEKADAYIFEEGFENLQFK